MIERDEVFRVRTASVPGTLARVLAAAAEFGAHIGEIETLYQGHDYNIREVTIIAPDDDSIVATRAAIAALDGVELIAKPVDKVFAMHEQGKIEVRPTVEVRTLQHMRQVYTPGVARVSAAIRDDPELGARYTWKGKTIAVVTNGSRVLGLGDIGPLASLPVMEGKALFYSLLVDINAVPIVIDAREPADIIETVMRIAPGFGGIHLEDIATPGIYDVESELERKLDIPVMHDDQHGTAVVVLAAVLSAAKILGRSIPQLTFGQVGLGAAGSAIARLALRFPFKEVVAFDPTPVAAERMRDLSEEAPNLRVGSSPEDFDCVVDQADFLVLTTGRAGLLTPDRVRPGQGIFAISNPEPEITIADARRAGAAIAADGSIVNNVLAYPGLFKGALEAAAGSITFEMKRAAAEALADIAPSGHLLPEPLDRSVHALVAERVAEAAPVAG